MPTGTETQPEAASRKPQTRSETLRQRRVNPQTKTSKEMVPRVTQESMSEGVAVEKEEVLLYEVKTDSKTDVPDRTNGLHDPQNGDLFNRTEQNIPSSQRDDDDDDGDGIVVEETSLSQPLLPSSERLIDEDEAETEAVIPHESSLMIAAQVFLPFLIAGFGTVGAGLVLDMVQVGQIFNVTNFGKF